MFRLQQFFHFFHILTSWNFLNEFDIGETVKNIRIRWN